MAGLVIVVIFCVYTALAVFIARRAGRLAHSRTGRNIVVAAVLVFLYVAPVADGIYGYFVLQRLCATEAKTEVLKPIRIPPEYFNPDGSPKFVVGEFKHVDWRLLRETLQLRNVDTNNYTAANLIRAVSTLVDIRNGDVLVRSTSFIYRGGWLRFNGGGIGVDNCVPRPWIDELILQRMSPP